MTRRGFLRFLGFTPLAVPMVRAALVGTVHAVAHPLASYRLWNERAAAHAALKAWLSEYLDEAIFTELER